MTLKQLLSAIALLCPCISGFAEPTKLNDVIVNANRVPPPSIADVNLSQYNGFQQMLTREQFADSLVNISDIINIMPSVQTYSAGGIGSYSSASVRGSTGKQINVFVDGILLSSPQSGYSNLGNIPSAVVEAIEVFPDYTPVELTDGNLAGAINIRTRNLQNENGASVSAGFGSYNTQSYSASGWLGNASTNGIIAASTTSSDNDFDVTPELFPNVSTGNSKHRENAGFDSRDFFGKLRHTLNSDYALNLMSAYSNSINEIATNQNFSEPAATFDTRSYRGSVGIESTFEQYNWGSRLYTNLNDSTFRDLQQSIALNAQHTLMTENTTGVNLFTKNILGKNTLSASLDMSDTNMDKESKTGLKAQFDGSREKIIVAASDVWNPLNPLSFYALTRFYHIKDTSESSAGNFSASCNAGNAECMHSTINENSIQLGSSYQFNHQWKIKSNIGQLVRVPTLSEKFGEQGNYIGEPDLKPEKSTSIDTGLQYSSALLDAELVAFYKSISNGIYISYDSRGVGHPSNINDSEIAGLEFTSSIRTSQETQIQLSGYTMDSENKSIVKANKGKLMHGIYHNGYVAAFIWCSDAHTISTNYQVDDDLYYTPSNSVKAGKKDTINTSYTYFLHKWTFNVGINNLLNKQYSDYNRMPSMGRFYNAQIQYQF